MQISRIVYHSGEAEKDSVFVCIRGEEADGHDFAQEAVERGSLAVICEKPLKLPETVTVVQTNDCRKTMAYMAAAFFGNPAKEMTLIGVTGTKGKTTTSYMIQAALLESGFKTGLISTVHIDTGKEQIESKHTTPESVEVQQYLRQMADAGCKAAVMEVSSQALMRSRVEGITFDYAVFTNIQEDHIGPGEHKNLKEYIYWKSRLFTRCRKAVVNGDDPNLPLILKDCTCPVITYGFGKGNSLRGSDVNYVRTPGKLGVEFQIKGDYNINLAVDLAGKFSCSNAMAASAVACDLCKNAGAVRKALWNIRIPGRQEMFSPGDDKIIMVDYAHNGQALENLLSELRNYGPAKVSCIFGCGGERDPERRIKMAEAAAKWADFTIVTTDNPRREPPQNIIKDIVSVLVEAECDFAVIPNRAEAISYGVSRCEKGEILAVCGKGHEHYQIIGKDKIYFDDRAEVLQSIEKVKYENNYTS